MLVESHQIADAIISRRGEEVGDSTPTESGDRNGRPVRVRQRLRIANHERDVACLGVYPS